MSNLTPAVSEHELFGVDACGAAVSDLAATSENFSSAAW